MGSVARACSSSHLGTKPVFLRLHNNFLPRFYSKEEDKRTSGNEGPLQTGPHPSPSVLQPPAPRCLETFRLIGGWRCGPRLSRCGHLGNLSSARTSEPGLSGCCHPWVCDMRGSNLETVFTKARNFVMHHKVNWIRMTCKKPSSCSSLVLVLWCVNPRQILAEGWSQIGSGRLAPVNEKGVTKKTRRQKKLNRESLGTLSQNGPC